jgi:hypothetical protein
MKLYINLFQELNSDKLSSVIEGSSANYFLDFQGNNL